MSCAYKRTHTPPAQKKLTQKRGFFAKLIILGTFWEQSILKQYDYILNQFIIFSLLIGFNIFRHIT